MEHSKNSLSRYSSFRRDPEKLVVCRSFYNQPLLLHVFLKAIVHPNSVIIYHMGEKCGGEIVLLHWPLVIVSYHL